MRKKRHVDKTFLAITAFLLLGGFFIFVSASLGLLARDGVDFSSVAFNQVFFGFILGSTALYIFSRIPYHIFKKYAWHIFFVSTVITALVFIPALSLEHAGATRWIKIGFLSFQPAEFLKLATIIILAAWFSDVKQKIKTVRWGLVPLCIILGITGLLLLAQPDTGTFSVIMATAVILFYMGGARWRDIGAIVLAAVLGIVALALARPYIMERLITFLDPSRDPSGAGWQIQQSLIAIGSGDIFGVGFGQSVQKFSFLPEPIGDSIFAVAAEEFGFLGSIIIIGAFLAFLARGFYIAKRAPDAFGGLLVAGIVIMIVSQSFLNIAAMVSLLPLTGLPLLFISHGGTALLFALVSVGIILNVSRHIKT